MKLVIKSDRQQIIQGHDGGVLSISWCAQDSDLLLSCGKDNRNICWNPQTGESWGEFPVVTNWTFQTRWNPHNPGLMATASFDGKIAVQPIQNTKFDVDGVSANRSNSIDDDDFFNKAQTQPRGPRFTLKKAPKWLQRPCGVSFGFGGKLVSFKANASESPRRSMIRILAFAIDDGIASSTETFESALKAHDLEGICESRIASATTEEEEADWRIIKTLRSKDQRKELVDYLGFSSRHDEAVTGVSNLAANGTDEKVPEALKEPSASSSNRLSSYFDNSADGDSFLSELAAAKGAKTNNPFQLYSGSESEADRQITRELLLGEFGKVLDICLREDRMSDAFMIAICGGQQCIEKAQKAYFNRKMGGPSYLRLLASVVGKNLWDLVHNADLENWKEIIVTLCTYADPKEFPDLCEALGDRLVEQTKFEDGIIYPQKNASFCYLAGSKLEKVVPIWISELEENEAAGMQNQSGDSSFFVHAHSLQSFIEKVTVFRGVTQYQDSDESKKSEWKLAPLYDKYAEYANIASTHGQLEIAERYLDLLPSSYPAAEVAKSRVKLAMRKATPQGSTKQPMNTVRAQLRTPQQEYQRQHGLPVQFPVDAQQNQYTPSSTIAPQTPYGTNNSQYSASGYGQQFSQQSQQQSGNAPLSNNINSYQNLPVSPPPRNINTSPSILPPSKAANMSNWNDTPEDFFKERTSRRGTPGAGATPSSTYQLTQQPTGGPTFGAPLRSTPPLGPPPKRPVGPPPMLSSPSMVVSQYQQPERPSSVANIYTPPQSLSTLPAQQQAPIPRGPSPYNLPPSSVPPSNRYAPAQPAPSTTQQEPQMMPRPNPQATKPYSPYALRQTSNAPRQQASQQPPPSAGPPPRSAGPSSGPPQPPQQGSRPGTAQSQRKSSAPPPKHGKSMLSNTMSSSLLTLPSTWRPQPYSPQRASSVRDS